MNNCPCKKILSNATPYDEVIIKNLLFLHKDIYEGWGEISYQCRTCGQLYVMTEDVGYHYPVYSLREGS
jgi:hypothetical protein